MSESKVAKRYAKSLLGLGLERNIIDRLYDDITLIRDTIAQNRDLALLLKSPIVNADIKENILNSLFGDHVDKLTGAYLKIIVRKKREYYIEDIVSAFVAMYKNHQGVKSAYAITAVPIDDELKNEMLEIIKQTTNFKIELNEVEDKNIIGGFILRWDDLQIDASVTKKLDNLRQDFDSNLYLKEY
jgi:F-type H+-transporting ATPase subunit delta